MIIIVRLVTILMEYDGNIEIQYFNIFQIVDIVQAKF